MITIKPQNLILQQHWLVFQESALRSRSSLTRGAEQAILQQPTPQFGHMRAAATRNEPGSPSKVHCCRAHRTAQRLHLPYPLGIPR